MSAVTQRRPVLKETDVVRQITDLMKAEGYRIMRLQSGVFVSDTRILRIGERGLPDWLFLRRSEDRCRPVAMFVEIKAPGKKPRPEQVAWINEAIEAGLLACWTDDLDSFRSWMRSAIGAREVHGG